MTATATALPAPQTPAPAALADIEVTATAGAWLKALREVGIAVSGRPPMPVLSAFVLSVDRDGVTLRSTNYEISVSTVLDAPKRPRKVGQVLVPYSWLARTIRTLTGKDKAAEVTVSTAELMGERLVMVKALGYSIPVLSSLDVDSFPTAFSGALSGAFEVDGPAFVGAMKRATHAAAIDETLPILNGVSVVGSAGNVEIFATDRYRLTSETFVLDGGQHAPEFSFIMPLRVWKAVAPVLKAERLQIATDSDESKMEIISDDLVITIAGTGGDYPKLKALFSGNTEAFTAEVSAAALSHQARVAVELCERYTPGMLSVVDGGMSFTPSATTAAPITAPPVPALAKSIDPAHQGMDVGLNPNFLQAAIASIPGDRVRFTLLKNANGKTGGPICLTAGGVKATDPKAYRILIMPVRAPERAA